MLGAKTSPSAWKPSGKKTKKKPVPLSIHPIPTHPPTPTGAAATKYATLHSPCTLGPLQLCCELRMCAFTSASGPAECTVSAPSRPERLVWGDQVLEALEGLQPCLQAFNSFAVGHPLTGTIRLRLASSRPGSGWKLQFDLFASLLRQFHPSDVRHSPFTGPRPSRM